jgi:hypothetical protein
LVGVHDEHFRPREVFSMLLPTQSGRPPSNALPSHGSFAV